MTTVDLIHASERFDRPVSRVIRDGKVYRQAAGLVTRTEMSGDERHRLFPVKDWSVCQGEGFTGEVMAEWSNAVWSLAGMPEDRVLTQMRFNRQGGTTAPKTRCTIVPLRLATAPRKVVILVIMHMSLDNTDKRAAIWKDVAGNFTGVLAEYRKAWPGCEVIVAADFNKNYRDARERALIESYYCKPNGLTQAWDHGVPANGGTHGRALIDGWLVSDGIKVRKIGLLDDTDSSDHRPCALRITL